MPYNYGTGYEELIRSQVEKQFEYDISRKFYQFKMMISFLLILLVCFAYLSYIIIKRLQRQRNIQQKTIEKLQEELSILKAKEFHTLNVPSPIPKNKSRLSAL